MDLSGEYDINSRILTQLGKMSERDFTLNVIIPIFKVWGYDKVDYFGGPYEEGKDVVCWRNDELGQVELTVIQVKKIRYNAKAASRRSFSEIVNQLQQAYEKKVPNVDGNSYYPSYIYFVTPYDIDTRSLQTRFEAVENLRRNRIKIIDGSLIVRLLNDHLPDVVVSIVGDELAITKVMLENLTNVDLCSALNRAARVDLSSFYCDLEFSIGRTTSNIFFARKYKPKTLSVKYNETWLSP